ncbi:hypothetical protein HY623_04620 [Candidatus Uhrbacteria bacterium]|nr:hypothetical protein [Candidatus Uhrbacteria bacterium]
MALTPFPREKFESADDDVREAVENIEDRLFSVDRAGLEGMANAIDSKKQKSDFARKVESLFRRGIANPECKLTQRPKDILATLVEQEVARKMFHGTADFTSPLGRKELAEIEEQVKALLPKSESEGRAVIDCMRRFDTTIQEALDNDDEMQTPMLWQTVQDYYIDTGKSFGILSARREATLTFLRGQLLGRVRDMLDPSDLDADRNQRKFVEMFEHTNLLNGLTKKDMPVQPDRLAHSGVQREVLELLNRQFDDGVEPRTLEALELGVIEARNVPMHLAERTLERAASQTVDDDSSLERLARVFSDTKVPFSNYAEAVNNSRVKEQTIGAMRAMLEGGSTLPEWQDGIAQFDAFVKNRVLEPFSALPDTPGHPDAEKKMEILVTIPATISTLQKELDAAGKQQEVMEKELKDMKSDRLIKKAEDKLAELDKTIEELKKNIKSLADKYGPSEREALFAPYRRLSKDELDDTISNEDTKKKQLQRLISLFEQGHDDDFITFRAELLKERGKDAYWQYRIIKDADLVHPRFVDFMERIAVERLKNLASDSAKQTELRKRFIDKHIVSDAALRSKGV